MNLKTITTYFKNRAKRKATRREYSRLSERNREFSQRGQEQIRELQARLEFAAQVNSMFPDFEHNLHQEIGKLFTTILKNIALEEQTQQAMYRHMEALYPTKWNSQEWPKDCYLRAYFLRLLKYRLPTLPASSESTPD